MLKKVKQQNITKSDDLVKLIDSECEQPTSVRDLKRIAKESGVKYITIMSKKDLCEVLGVKLVKPIRYSFRNDEIGEEHRFHSIYKASKKMGVNPGLIHYYLGKKMTIGGTTYTVSKVQ